MITSKTVFVLGAGASMPYGFPSGNKLVKDVYSIQNGSEDLGFLHEACGKYKEHIEDFIQDLKLSGSTVDTFLSQRPEFEKVGKTAIAMMVAKYEQEGSLFKENIRDNWYQYLYERMRSPFDSFHENQVAFISFNYDRSLEHYLFKVLKHGFGKTRREVAEVLSKIPFIHVHGRLGYLPWQTMDNRVIRSYEPKLRLDSIRIAAEGIKVISDSVDDSDEIKAAHNLLEQSERIFFLGFHYHPENMRRLNVPLDSSKKIYGTAVGFTDEEIKEMINHRYKGMKLGNPNHQSKDFLRNNVAFINS